jgi:hypothetical protein
MAIEIQPFSRLIKGARHLPAKLHDKMAQALPEAFAHGIFLINPEHQISAKKVEQ